MPVAALILGILALILCFVPFVAQILGLLAIIFGIIAMVGGKKRNRSGFGMGLAGLITGGTGMLVGVLLFAGLLLPAISSARDTARRMESANNLKQLLMTCVAYEIDYGSFPPDLQTLIADQNLSPRVLVHPNDTALANPYCYVRTTSQAPSIQPVMVANPAAFDGRGANVVFVDGHVEWFDGDRAQALYEHARALAPRIGPVGVATADDWQPVMDLIRSN